MDDFPITWRYFENEAIKDCLKHHTNPYDVIRLASPRNVYPTCCGTALRWELVADEMLKKFKNKPFID